MDASRHVAPSTLWSLVADELAPEQLDRVSRHIDACGSCATELERKRVAHRLLRDSALVEVPDPVRQRLEATITRLGDAVGEGASPPER